MVPVKRKEKDAFTSLLCSIQHTSPGTETEETKDFCPVCDKKHIKEFAYQEPSSLCQKTCSGYATEAETERDEVLCPA